MASYAALSSEDLITACVGLDSDAAWAEFIRRFRPVIAKAILRTARHWVEPSRTLLDDLIQDTYLKLCADKGRVLRAFQSRHRNSIFGFLKVVASRVVHDHFKSERARKRDANQTEVLSECNAMDPPLIGGVNGLDHLEKRVALHQIDAILVKVVTDEHRERNRAIFWLHYRYGMTASAIASIPSLRLNTKGVETVLARMTHLIQGHIGTNK